MASRFIVRGVVEVEWLVTADSADAARAAVENVGMDHDEYTGWWETTEVLVESEARRG